MAIDSPEQRASSARNEIRYLTQEIDYHDRQASQLRKEREAQKAKLARAEKAIERSKQFAKHHLQMLRDRAQSGPTHD